METITAAYLVILMHLSVDWQRLTNSQCFDGQEILHTWTPFHILVCGPCGQMCISQLDVLNNLNSKGAGGTYIFSVDNAEQLALSGNPARRC
jgi:hypothetical protein